jgi:CubicO group peptidase (beta-lactamase class C family)
VSDTKTATFTAELLAVAREECARWSVPGMAIGVLRDGAAELVASGVASLETGFAVRPDTLFQAGSISKIVTTTLVLQLVDAGQIALDAPIVTYLPDFRLADAAATAALTMRHLLTHTGGFFGDRFDDYGGGADALAKAVAAFDTLRQYTPPGAYWAYNNNGFQLAGRVAERLLGEPFETLVRERVFVPAGMQRTTYFADEAITYPVATGHNWIEGRGNQVAHRWARARCRNPQGGVVTCVGDLLRFAGIQLNGGESLGGRILSAESVAAMQTPQVEAIQAPHWGLGWWIDSVDGEKVIGHGGVTNGFQAQLTLVPARSVAFALLSNGNQGGAAIRAIEGWLYRRCLSLRRSDAPAVRLPAGALGRLRGRYEGALARCTVEPDEDGALRLVTEAINPFTGDVAPPATARAEPIGGLRFRFVDGVDAGSLFDFVNGAAESAPPQYLRLNNRLLDRQT